MANTDKPVKITAFEAENVKRVKAVQLLPTANGLTVIGGRNNQGKTSVLDAIAWALGGDRNKPEHPKREGSVNDPKLHVELSNGIIVERKGKKSSLKVIDPTGNKAGQKLLDSFIDQLALDLPKFLESSDKEKANTLLKIIGVGDELAVLDDELATLENRRLETGRIARQKRGAAEELPFYAEAPAEEISASELIARQQAILQRNAENQAKRDNRERILTTLADKKALRDTLNSQLDALQKQIASVTDELNALMQDKLTADDEVRDLVDEPTAEIEADIEAIDETNSRIRANRRRSFAIAEAEEFKATYEVLSGEIEGKRHERTKLLDDAKMPLEGLSVEDGKLTYFGQTWDGMSGSDRLKVSTAIVRELKPQCGFVLVDKLEQMDSETLREFGEWAEHEGLQIIGTRVATDDTCTIVIEDGYARSPEAAPVDKSGAALAADSALTPATSEPFKSSAPQPPIFNFPGSDA